MSAPVMPLWVDSYLAATTDLTATEHGAYLLLLMAAWKNDGRLPNDDKKLARIARVTSGQWARMKDDILSFWDIEDGFITQSRLTKELGAVKRKSASASNSARSRWLKTNKVDDANASDPQCYPKPEPNKLSSKAPPNPQGGRRRRRATGFIEPDLSTTSAFDEFWQVYPRKVGKLAAKDLFQRYSAEHQRVLIEAAKRFAADMAKERRDPTKIPHPKTWLNPERGGFGDYVKGPTNGADRRTGDEQRGADAPRAEDGPAGHDERVLRGGESVRRVPGGDGPVECAAPGGREGVGGVAGLPAPLGAGRAEPHHIRAGSAQHPRRDDLDANPLALGDDGHSGGRPAWVH